MDSENDVMNENALLSADEYDKIVDNALIASDDLRAAMHRANKADGDTVPLSAIDRYAAQFEALEKFMGVANAYANKLINEGMDEADAYDSVSDMALNVQAISCKRLAILNQYTDAAIEVINLEFKRWIDETIENGGVADQVQFIGVDAMNLVPGYVDEFSRIGAFRLGNSRYTFQQKALPAEIAEYVKTAFAPYFDYLKKKALDSAKAEELYRKLDALIDSEAEKWFEQTDLSDVPEKKTGKRRKESRPPKADIVGLDIGRHTQLIYALTGGEEELVADGSPQVFPVSNKNGNFGSLMVGLSFGDDQDAYLSVNFDKYDWLVANAVNTLVEQQARANGAPLEVTAQQVLRYVNATPNAKPSPEQISRIEESLDKMISAVVTIDLTGDTTFEDSDLELVKGHLYDGMKMDRRKIGGVDTNTYYIPATSATWQISKIRKQMFTIPANFLETPGKRTTVEQKEIQATLFKRLAPMRGKNAKKTPFVITWGYLYDAHEVDKTDRKKTAAFRKKVEDQLTLWRDKGLILNFYQIKKNHDPIRPNEKRPTAYGLIVVTEENAEEVRKDLRRFA